MQKNNGNSSNTSNSSNSSMATRQRNRQRQPRTQPNTPGVQKFQSRNQRGNQVRSVGKKNVVKSKPFLPGRRTTPGQAIAKMTGSNGTVPLGDVRPARLGSLISKDMVNLIDREIQVNERAIYSTALGIILQGIRHGACYPDIDLFQAYAYLASLFLNAFQGERLEGVQLPWQIWELAAAFAPKKTLFKTGNIEYSAKVVPSANTTYTQTRIEYQAFMTSLYSLNLGPLLPSVKVQNFNAIDTVTPVVNLAAGAEALGKIWSKLGISELFTLQNYTPYLQQDVSAYAAVVTEMGSCFDAPGGVRTAVSNEVFIPSPVLAHYSPEVLANTTLDEIARGFQQYRAGGVGPLYVGSRVMEFAKPKDFENKAIPVVKFYEFFDLFERFSLWLCRLQEMAAKDQSNSARPPWPFTAQTTAILLRQIAMTVCDNEIACDIANFSANSDEVPMIPFAPGQTTTFRTGVTADLPSFLSENLRCVRRHLTQVYNGILDVIPVLATSTLTGDYRSYQYEWQDALGAYQPLFNATVDPFISIIDGSTPSGNTTLYLNLDGEELAKIYDAMNAWVKEYADFSTKLSPVSDESATYALQPTYFTMHTQVKVPITVDTQSSAAPTVGPAPKVLAKKASVKKLIIGQSAVQKHVRLPRPSGTATSFLNANVTGITGNFRPLAAAWKYQKLQWIPRRYVNYGGTLLERGLAWYQTQLEEPAYCNMQTQGQDLLDIDNVSCGSTFERNLRAAEIDIKSKLSEESEWQKDCEMLQWKGEGGLFGKIADMFGSAIGVPQIGNWIGAIENALS